VTTDTQAKSIEPSVPFKCDNHYVAVFIILSLIIM